MSTCTAHRESQLPERARTLQLVEEAETERFQPQGQPDVFTRTATATPSHRALLFRRPAAAPPATAPGIRTRGTADLLLPPPSSVVSLRCVEVYVGSVGHGVQWDMVN